MNKRVAYFGGLAFTLLLLFTAAAAIALRLVEGMSLQQLRAVIESFGGMASTVFIIMCAVRGLVFIPCGVLSALGGLLFGPVQGTIITLIGLTAGSVITFYLARVFGKGWAQRVLGHKYERYEGYISRDSFYSIFLMRVVPILPFDAVSCIAGMSKAGVVKFILGTLMGSLPGVFIYVYFGDSIGSLSIKRAVFSAAFIAAFAILPLLFRYLLKYARRFA